MYLPDGVFQTTRTLDVHEEEFDGVFCVTEDGGFAVERAAVDLVAGVIRNEAAAFKSAFEGGAAGAVMGELGKVGGVCAAVSMTPLLAPVWRMRGGLLLLIGGQGTERSRWGCRRWGSGPCLWLCHRRAGRARSSR